MTAMTQGTVHCVIMALSEANPSGDSPENTVI